MISRLHFGPWTIEGLSRATAATCLFIKELNILFDIGWCSPRLAGAPAVFITHLHLDHCTSLPFYAAYRSMIGIAPPKVYLPAENVQQITRIMDGYASLQGAKTLPCQFIGLKAGDEVKLKGNHWLRAYATNHSIPSLGYAIIEKRKKLLPQFNALSKEELIGLKHGGEEITELKKRIVLSYTGDTSKEGLIGKTEVLQAENLIAECTFLSEDHHENAGTTEHLHIRDLAELSVDMSCHRLLLTHFSLRYREAEIRRMIQETFPSDGRIAVQALLTKPE